MVDQWKFPSRRDDSVECEQIVEMHKLDAVLELLRFASDGRGCSRLVLGNLNRGKHGVAGGGHNTLNVGSEGADFVPFFYNYGVNTIIMRNRLRRDGYNPQTDAVNDALQSIRMAIQSKGALEMAQLPESDE